MIKIEYNEETRFEGLYYQPYPKPCHIRYLGDGRYVARIVHGEVS